MSEYNSMSSSLKYLMDLHKKTLTILNSINEATTTDKDNVTMMVVDSNGNEFEYKLPSYGYLNRKMNELNVQMKNLYLTRDKDMNKNIFGQYHISEPKKIDEVAIPDTFYSKPNYFFENLLNPLIYTKVDVSKYLESKSKDILIRRVLLDVDTPEKEDFFNKELNGKNNINYTDLFTNLSEYGISYQFDDERLLLPPLDLKTSGSFSVLQSYPDVVENSDYNSVRKYKLDKLSYTSVLDKNDLVRDNKILKVGDILITTEGNTQYKVIYVNQADNIVHLALYYGYDVIPVGKDVLKIGTLLDGKKEFHITLGYREKQVVFMKGVEPYDNTTSLDWSPGFSFNTDELFIYTDDGKVSFSDFYKNKVRDYGKIWSGLSKENFLSSIFVSKPDAPILSNDNFFMYILNEHLKNNTSVERKRELISRREYLDNKKRELQDIINADNDLLENGDGITPEERINILNRLESNLTLKNNTVSEIQSISAEIQDFNRKNLNKNKLKPKVVLDGAWEMPTPKENNFTGIQHINFFKIKVTYLDSNGNPNPTREIKLIKSNGDVEVCSIPPYKIYFTEYRRKIYKPNDKKYLSNQDVDYLKNTYGNKLGAVDGDDIVIDDSLIKDSGNFVYENIKLSDPTQRSINQLPEPIPVDLTNNERIKIEIKSCIKTIDNVVESDWSEPLIIENDDVLIERFSEILTLDDKVQYYSDIDSRNEDINALMLEMERIRTQLATISNTGYGNELFSSSIKYTITASDIVNKYIKLPQRPLSSDNLIVFPVGGIKGVYSTDYILIDDKLWWNGLSWDGTLEVGDVLELIYIV